MNQITLIPLNYSNHLHEFYQKFSSLPGFVLLESSDKTRGRYDILSAFPYDRFKLTASTFDKLTELKKLINHMDKKTNLDLPFQGGAIGYVAYDFGARLLDIVSPPQPGLEDLPLLDMGLYDWAIIVDHHLREVSLFAAHEHSSTANIIKEALLIWNQASMSSGECVVHHDFIPLISKQEYEDSFDSIHHSLLVGRSYQVNYTQSFHASYSGDAWELYKKISSANRVPFSAFIRTTDDADILCFSPERFLLYEQGTLLTSPIKGTIKRSVHPSEDEHLKRKLVECSKNRAENVMIVDLWRNDLGKLAKPKTVKVSNLCRVESYGAVHHLVSDIQAECLDTVEPFDIFMSCFPGGSITGAPKIESMKIIAEQERFARGVYCGSIGYFSRHGRFDMNIAIRTITAKNSILHLAAGGGIVIDSDCSDEYNECYIKIAAIINGLK